MSTTNHITPSTAHRGPGATASILTWFLTVTVVLSVIARLGFKFTKVKLRARDDIALCIATLFHVAQCVAVSFEADAGLGQYRATLSDNSLLRFEKANYAADVLFIPTLCMAQTSAFFLVESIPASKPVKKAVRYTNLANLTWSAIATLCVVFRSHIPNVWSLPATSINLPVFWIIECAISITIEVILIGVPFWVIAPLQATRRKRTAMLISFSFRIFVIAAIIAHIIIAPSTSTLKADLTRNLTGPVIASQAVLSSAIVMTSIPVLSRFMDQFETGMLRIHGSQAARTGTYSSSNFAESYKMSHLTSRTRVTVGKESRIVATVAEADERTESQEMLGPTIGNEDLKRTRRRSSDLDGILINRSWDLHYETSEEKSSHDERPASVS